MTNALQLIYTINHENTYKIEFSIDNLIFGDCAKFIQNLIDNDKKVTIVAKRISAHIQDNKYNTIYDGDVLEINGTTYIVEYKKDESAFVYFVPGKEDEYKYLKDIDIRRTERLVVGDIYTPKDV